MKTKTSVIFLPVKIMFKADSVKLIALLFIAITSGYLNYFALHSLDIIFNSDISKLFSIERISLTILPALSYFFISILNFVSNNIIQKLEYKTGLYINNLIIKRSFGFKGIGIFEHPDYINMSYTLANAKSIMASSVQALFTFLSLVLNFVFYVFFFAKIELIFLLILIPALFPIYFTEKAKARIFMQKQLAMQQLRIRGYQYKFMVLSAQHAQDNRIFSFIPVLKKNFEKLNVQIDSTWNKFNTKKLVVDFIAFSANIIVTALVIAVSFFRFSNNQITFATSVILIFAVYRLFKMASSISMLIGVNKQTFLFYEQLQNYLQLLDTIDVSKSGKILNEPISSIEFKDVSFAYSENNYALKNLSFKIHAGESVALVGQNGAGKTTVIKLLLRFYDPSSGTILINGTDIKEWDIDSYRNAISGVFQDFSKFALTLGENIFGSSPIQNESAFSKKSEMLLAKILETMSDRCHTNIGADLGGRELSGGEWQKIAIARGLEKENSGLFIADEPVSAIDPIEEANIYKYILPEKTSKAITIITTHRLACTKDVTKVLLLENGMLQEFDSHENLLKTSERYKNMYRTQADAYVK